MLIEVGGISLSNLLELKPETKNTSVEKMQDLTFLGDLELLSEINLKYIDCRVKKKN